MRERERGREGREMYIEIEREGGEIDREKHTSKKTNKQRKQNFVKKVPTFSDGIPSQTSRRRSNSKRKVLFETSRDHSGVFHAANRGQKTFAPFRFCRYFR